GYASVTSGHDGDMINRQAFKDKIASLLISPESDNRSFVTETEFTPVAISRDEAQKTADLINDVISQGITFSCAGDTWFADASELGAWVQTPIVKHDDGSSSLAPSFALQTARTSVLTHIQPSYESDAGHIRFTNEGGEIKVQATSKGVFPLVGEALEQINIEFFSEVENGSNPSRTIELGTADIPEKMTLEEALSFGIITPISSFETEYTEGAFERNTNIHLAADLVNNSIVKADGGEWSFNGTAGECNAEKGFLEAGALTGGMLVDEIGGGICQVATTIFNAVYEAGYPIVQRFNHSVYFPNYPEGRDAAISWPSPDLKWRNDSPSDVLLVMSYTDSTITATLYGEDMDYRVESEEGEIIEGVKATTVYVDDDTLYPGVEYIRTNGSDGHSVTVTRKVYDSDDELIITDYFTSVYKPQNTIIVRGTMSQ
ncbi:MAG: VanW family protein, partial [Eggerthellaceae bacterium]|nr:VanW family protein [Eggerthellaceae bacterium]